MLKIFRVVTVLVLLMPFVSPSFAFTIHPEGDNHTSDIAWDDLQDANRWSMIEGTLVDDRVRGLDGGIEFAFSPTFCSEIVHHFIAYPVLTCDEVKQMVYNAFDMWAEGNRNLRFVDVTGQVETVLDSPYGAEIDIFAFTAEQYPRVESYSALTSWWWDTQNPVGTNGQVMEGRSLKGADIVFSVANRNCYYPVEPTIFVECNHFQSLALHEIGHALGLSHPDEMPHRNFDQDNNPRNSMSINCENPARGFDVSWNIDNEAVMNGRDKLVTPKFEGLRADDIGGRNFLYPVCDLGKLAVVSPEIKNSDLSWGGQLFVIMALVGFAIKIRKLVV